MRRGALALALVLGLAIVAGGLARLLLGAGPREGVELVYACDRAAAAHDAPAIRARLEHVDAWASVDVVDAQRLRLRVGSDPSSADLARSVVSTRVLEVMPVDEAAMRTLDLASLPPDVTHEGGYGDIPVTLVGPSRAAFAGLPVAAPNRWLVDCDGPGHCRAWIAKASALGNDDIASADANVGPSGQPQVAIALTPDGGRRFAELTAHIVGGRVALVLDGAVISVPVVQERITGGHLVMTLDARSTPGEAAAIAAALGGGQLACPSWELASEQLFRE
ncbi:MAG: hypothetical protein U0234_02450 [Sandaracinus sp.]